MENDKRNECSTNNDNTAKWKIQSGWTINGKSIENVECSRCGYKHQTVKGSLEKLNLICPGCNSIITEVVDEDGTMEKIHKKYTVITEYIEQFTKELKDDTAQRINTPFMIDSMKSVIDTDLSAQQLSKICEQLKEWSKQVASNRTYFEEQLYINGKYAKQLEDFKYDISQLPNLADHQSFGSPEVTDWKKNFTITHVRVRCQILELPPEERISADPALGLLVNGDLDFITPDGLTQIKDTITGRLELNNISISSTEGAVIEVVCEINDGRTMITVPVPIYRYDIEKFL